MSPKINIFLHPPTSPKTSGAKSSQQLLSHNVLQLQFFTKVWIFDAELEVLACENNFMVKQTLDNLEVYKLYDLVVHVLR